MVGAAFAPVPQNSRRAHRIWRESPLAPAFKWAEKFRISRIERYKHYLETLPQIEGLRLFGKPLKIEDKIPLFSLAVKGAHHEDLALILDKMGIAVRSGQMCAEPLMERYGSNGHDKGIIRPIQYAGRGGIFCKEPCKRR